MTIEDVPGRKTSGGAILSASWAMLRTDRSLLWLPVLSAASSLLAAIALFAPTFLLGRSLGATTTVDGWVAGALAAFGASVVAVYFQSALVIGAYQRSEGGSPTLRGVLAEAWRRRGPILSWALLSSSVGLLIRGLERRFGVVGQLLGFLGGLTWAIASFLVVPVVVAEGLGPIAALKRAAQLLRDTWGTSLRTVVRFGAMIVFATVVITFVFVIGVTLAVSESGAALVAGSVLLVASLVAFVGLVAVTSSVSAYARALIYRYAAGLPVPGVSQAALAGAFVPKKGRWR